MAIIKCIDCGHDVSTYADKCPNCGCPLSVIAGGGINSSPKIVNVVLENVGSKRLETIRFIREISIPKKGLSEAMDIIDNLPNTIIQSVDIKLGNTIVEKLSQIGCTARIEEIDNDNLVSESEIKGKEERVESTFLFSKDKPLTCPHCGSTAVTTGSRGYSLVWGFIGSNKTVNRCGRCGHSWNP